MAKYIDREALIEWLKRIPLTDLSDGRGLCRVIMEDNFKKAIKEMPEGIITDVEPVRHGRWEWFEEWSYSTPDHPAECDDCGWRCSKCKTALEDMINGYYDDSCEVPQLNYCPNCGAKMDGGDNSATD